MWKRFCDEYDDYSNSIINQNLPVKDKARFVMLHKPSEFDHGVTYTSIAMLVACVSLCVMTGSDPTVSRVY